jgi:hypothetical protein
MLIPTHILLIFDCLSTQLGHIGPQSAHYLVLGLIVSFLFKKLIFKVLALSIKDSLNRFVKLAVVVLSVFDIEGGGPLNSCGRLSLFLLL